MTEEGILVELRDIRKRLALLDDALSQLVALREVRIRSIMDAVRAPVSPEYHALLHQFAPRPEPVPMCAEDEPDA